MPVGDKRCRVSPRWTQKHAGSFSSRLKTDKKLYIYKKKIRYYLIGICDKMRHIQPECIQTLNIQNTGMRNYKHTHIAVPYIFTGCFLLIFLKLFWLKCMKDKLVLLIKKYLYLLDLPFAQQTPFLSRESLGPCIGWPLIKLIYEQTQRIPYSIKPY